MKLIIPQAVICDIISWLSVIDMVALSVYYHIIITLSQSAISLNPMI